MHWSKEIAEPALIGDYQRFQKALRDGNVRGYLELDGQIGDTVIDKSRPAESVLGRWSSIAAVMSRDNLYGPYMRFLDLCAERAVGIPISLRWIRPVAATQNPQ